MCVCFLSYSLFYIIIYNNLLGCHWRAIKFKFVRCFFFFYSIFEQLCLLLLFVCILHKYNIIFLTCFSSSCFSSSLAISLSFLVTRQYITITIIFSVLRHLSLLKLYSRNSSKKIIPILRPFTSISSHFVGINIGLSHLPCNDNEIQHIQIRNFAIFFYILFFFFFWPLSL